MSNFPFSDLIRNKRRDRRLSQKRIAETSGGMINQPAISLWETGNGLPRMDDPRLQVLGKILDVPVFHLQTALKKQLASGAQDMLLSEDNYLSNQETYIAAHKEEGATIWLLSAETDPVTDSDRFLDAWRQNLVAGISYHLVWRLCTDNIQLEKTVARLRQIGEKADGAGVIHHHAVMWHNEGQKSCESYCHVVYRRLSEQDIPRNRFHVPLEFGQDTEVIAALLEVSCLTAAVTVCQSGLIFHEPLVSVYLPSVRYSQDAAPESFWYYLARKQSFPMAILVQKLNAAQEIADKKSVPELLPSNLSGV